MLEVFLEVLELLLEVLEVILQLPQPLGRQNLLQDHQDHCQHQFGVGSVGFGQHKLLKGWVGSV